MKFDDIPVGNKERDAAWAAFIKRKDVQEFFKDKDDAFRFPLERGWYEVWCFAWHKAWDKGFFAKEKIKKQLKKTGRNDGTGN